MDSVLDFFSMLEVNLKLQVCRPMISPLKYVDLMIAVISTYCIFRPR